VAARSCHEEWSYAIFFRGLIHISSCPNQILNFSQITLHSCMKERTFDDLPLRIHLAAVDFVSLPTASLAFCVAIRCILTSSTILHCRCTNLVATVAGAHHVLKLHKKLLTADIRCNLLVTLQLNAAISIGTKRFDASKFPIVCCIAESLKTHEI
jgi:hypothetical protein